MVRTKVRIKLNVKIRVRVRVPVKVYILMNHRFTNWIFLYANFFYHLGLFLLPETLLHPGLFLSANFFVSELFYYLGLFSYNPVLPLPSTNNDISSNVVLGKCMFVVALHLILKKLLVT